MNKLDDTAALVESVRSRGYFVTKNDNRYDRKDMVRRLGLLQAGSLKLAAYQVRDPETDQWSPIQFHMTYDNCVMAMLGEESVKLLVTFVNSQLEKEV